MEIAEIIGKVESEMKAGFEKLEKGFTSKAELAQLQENLRKELNAALVAKAAGEKKVKVFGTQAELDLAKSAMAYALKSAGQDLSRNSYWTTKAANLNGTDAGAGAEFIPSLIDPVVSKLIQQYGVARSYCRVIPNVHGTLNLKKRLTRATVGFAAAVGVLRADADATPSGSTYGSVPLTPHEIIGLTTVEEKLVWDSPINILNEVYSDLAESAGIMEDDVLFRGDGTIAYGNFTGLGANTEVLGSTVSIADTTATKFVDAMLGLQAKVHASVVKSGDARYYLHPSVLATLMVQKDGVGRFIFDPTTNSFMVGGYPLTFTASIDSALTAGKVPVFFGNLNRAVSLGLGRPSELRVLIERYADSGELGVRLTYDIGFATVQPTAMAKLTMAS